MFLHTCTLSYIQVVSIPCVKVACASVSPHLDTQAVSIPCVKVACASVSPHLDTQAVSIPCVKVACASVSPYQYTPSYMQVQSHPPVWQPQSDFGDVSYGVCHGVMKITQAESSHDSELLIIIMGTLSAYPAQTLSAYIFFKFTYFVYKDSVDTTHTRMHACTHTHVHAHTFFSLHVQVETRRCHKWCQKLLIGASEHALYYKD